MIVLTVERYWRRRLLAMAAVAASVGLAYLGSLVNPAPRGLPAAAQPAPLRQVPGGNGRVALTFNITWGDQVPARVLDALAQHRTRATFFVTGRWAEAHPDLVQRMVRDGHEPASLGYEVAPFTGRRSRDLRQNMERGARVLAALTGRRPAFYRPPDGEAGADVLAAAAAAGLRVVLWNLDSHDWANVGPDYVVDRIMRRVGAGDVLLLTASDVAASTPDALLSLLPALRAKGLAPTTLGELLGAGAAVSGR